MNTFDLAAKNRENIAQKLAELLASNYILYLKTQNFHWNVTGPFFQTLHEMFEGQYDALAEANDEIAERIRALGVFAPGSFAEFAQISFIEESTGRVTAKNMVQELLDDHQKMIAHIREILVLAGELTDDATGDLLAPLINNHEKTSWMLRAFLAE